MTGTGSIASWSRRPKRMQFIYLALCCPDSDMLLPHGGKSEVTRQSLRCLWIPDNYSWQGLNGLCLPNSTKGPSARRSFLVRQKRQHEACVTLHPGDDRGYLMYNSAGSGCCTPKARVRTAALEICSPETSFSNSVVKSLDWRKEKLVLAKKNLVFYTASKHAPYMIILDYSDPCTSIHLRPHVHCC